MKLVKFEGTIDLKRDSSTKVSKTLDALKTYLAGFEETDAAKIIESFKGIVASKTSSQQDKILSKKFLQEYKSRSKLLEEIASSIKKIQEDLVDEQDTTIHDTKTKKSKELISKASVKVKSVFNKAKQFNPLDLAKSLFNGLLELKNLLPRLLSGVVGVVSGFLLSGTRLVTKVVGKGLKLVTKLAFKGVGFVVKSVVKIGKFFGKVAIQALKSVGGWLLKIGKFIAKGVTKGLSSMGNMMKGLFNKIKSSIRPGSTSPKGQEVKAKTLKPSKTTKLETSLSTTKKAPIPTESKGWISKISDSIKSIKSKVIPTLSRLGGKSAGKIAAAIGKSVTKVTSKAIPIIGWGMLAYDAYNAVKKSDSLVSFGVNLLDEASGGIISAVVGNMNGAPSLGHYVEALAGMRNDIKIQSSDDSSYSKTANSANSAIANGNISAVPGANALDLAAKSIQRINQIKSENSVVLEAQNIDVSNLTREFANNPNLQNVLQQIQQGSITVNQARTLLQSNNLNLQTVKKEVTISDGQTAIYQQIKDQAVFEAVQVAQKLDQNNLVLTGNAMQTLQHNVKQNVQIRNQSGFANGVDTFARSQS